MSGTASPHSAFIDFLEIVLWLFRENVKAGRPWPKGANRFDYWHSELCRTARNDHRDRQGSRQAERKRALEQESSSEIAEFSMSPRASQSWRKDFVASYMKPFFDGETDAIFEYARDDRQALQEPWVVDQLIQWRLTGTPEAKRFFDRFMRAYWGEWGKRRPQTRLEEMERDQAIYTTFLRRGTISRALAVAQLAEQFRLGQESIRLVLKQYARFHRSWETDRMSPRLSLR